MFHLQRTNLYLLSNLGMIDRLVVSGSTDREIFHTQFQMHFISISHDDFQKIKKKVRKLKEMFFYELLNLVRIHTELFSPDLKFV